MAVVSSRVSDRALESVCSAVGEMVQSPRKRPRTKKDSQLSNWSEDLGLTDNLQCEGHAEERLATLSEGFGTILEGSAEVPSPFPLAQCVALSNSSNDQLLLSISLDGWIKNYKSDPNSAVVALANFLIGAAGLQKVDLDLSSVRDQGNGDPLDELLNESRCAELIEEALSRSSYIEPYPIADRKTGKKFKMRLVHVVDTLLEKIQHEILYDQVGTGD